MDPLGHQIFYKQGLALVILIDICTYSAIIFLYSETLTQKYNISFHKETFM